ncbi:MAG: BrnT family toxin [Chloroflexi bacterium]|nr:BrnT family toxin [Chloroflexota bacterium]
MEFEWGPAKADKNLAKHGVSFIEAATVFADPLSVVFDDPDHSGDENRFIIVGTSIRRRLLVVAHTDRSDRTRIISAREATNSERQFYEEGY